MKISKTASIGHERQILIGLIVDKNVLAKIAPKFQNGMFRTPYSNLIAQWCVNYFNKYGKPPQKHIEAIFSGWAEENKDKNTIELIEKFLSSLSEQYEDLKKDSNSQYIIDIAGKYFNEVKLEKLSEAIQNDVETGEINRAKERVNNYRQIELGVGTGVDVLQDKEAIKEAFREKTEPLIQYPGALGEFFGNSLERDGFISFMGPEKRGKTWWLIDIAYRAMLQRKKVAFFAVGDMSQNQMMRRFMIRAAARPLLAKEIKYPIKIEKESEDENARVKYKIKNFKKPLSWQKAYKICKNIMHKKIKSNKPLLKLSCFPNSTLKVKEIENILKEWEKEEWTADVIVIDYADILNMDYYGLEGRERINETWKQLRALSQKYHCLVVTATQSDADSYDVKTMGKSNFSEDKRKIAHVTGMIGLNQTNEEKINGVMRLNWIARREEEFHEFVCVYVAGCLSIGNPAVKSCYEDTDKDVL